MLIAVFHQHTCAQPHASISSLLHSKEEKKRLLPPFRDQIFKLLYNMNIES